MCRNFRSIDWYLKHKFKSCETLPLICNINICCPYKYYFVSHLAFIGYLKGYMKVKVQLSYSESRVHQRLIVVKLQSNKISVHEVTVQQDCTDKFTVRQGHTASGFRVERLRGRRLPHSNCSDMSFFSERPLTEKHSSWFSWAPNALAMHIMSS
jgi:hypothetical protein